MRHLKLVVNRDHAQEFSGLISAFEGLLDADDVTVEINRFYGLGSFDMPMAYVTNEDSGIGIRIILDVDRQCAGRQGIHTTLEIDEYELADKLVEADSQGFDTIWVHS